MIVVIFRNRLRDDAHGYAERAKEIAELAREQPGILSFKTFAAPDGERVTIAEFDDLESVDAWKNHPAHAAARIEGRENFYAEYNVQVATVERSLNHSGG